MKQTLQILLTREAKFLDSCREVKVSLVFVNLILVKILLQGFEQVLYFLWIPM